VSTGSNIAVWQLLRLRSAAVIKAVWQTPIKCTAWKSCPSPACGCLLMPVVACFLLLLCRQGIHVLFGTEGASSVSSVFTLCNSAIGAGVLSLPYAFQCAGMYAA
jgi:hypothetical protein